MEIDSSQLASLLSVLSEDNTSSQTLEAIATTFHQFFTKQDHFKIGCALVSLLQNKDLIVHPTQRIVCIFFLYDMYRTDPIALNPFAPVFTYLVSPPTTAQNKEFNWSLPKLTAQEKYFVSQIITNPSSKDMFKKTPTQILQMDQNNLNLSSIDISGLQVSIVEKLSQLPHMSKAGLPCVVSDVEASRYGYDESAPKNGSDSQKQCLESLLVGSDAPFKKFIRPEMIRLAPPLHFEQDELVWLDPDVYTPEFAWDNSILNTSEIRKLLVKACRTQLTIQQQSQLENAFTKDSSLVLQLDLTPAKFAQIVDLNPAIAVKIILSYQQLDSIDLSPYLEELLKTKMSLHSMEVVNKLAMKVILPDEFIHLYISTCISRCESITEDRALQNRLVRLLCAFVQSLIRNKIIDAKDLHIELQPFCIEFSSVKEANSLYRLLKSMNNGESAAGSVTNTSGGASTGSTASIASSSNTSLTANTTSSKSGK